MHIIYIYLYLYPYTCIYAHICVYKTCMLNKNIWGVKMQGQEEPVTKSFDINKGHDVCE